MSEIKRFDIPRNGNEFLHEDPDGEYVLYDDHLAEMLRMRAEVRRLTGDLSYTIDRCRALELSIEQADEMKAHAEASAAAEEAETDRVTAERDAAQAEVERLTQELEGRRATNRRVMAERDAAQAEVERLTVRLEHAQARIVPPLPHTGESASLVQGKMDAYVTSLNAELHETREQLARVQAQYDEFARVTAKTIGQHQRERDDARQQVYRLQQACAGSPSDQSAQNLDMVVANCKETLTSSRPTDEDIWREAFITMLPSYPWEKAAEQSDRVLVEYRKRWPR